MASGIKGRVVYRSRNVRVSFDMDYSGIAKVAVGPELKAVCHHIVAVKALPYAKSISPRSRAKHPHYQDMFEVEDLLVEEIGKPPMVRVGTRLVNTSEHAIIVEVGTKKVPKHRVLGKTLAALAALS